MPLLLRIRQTRGKEDEARRAERLGGASMSRPAGFLIWFHAASVGEANAVLPLIEALAETRPEIQVLLTSGTVTSAKLATARLPSMAMHQFVPLDTPRFMRRFLDHWQPDLAVLAESEIWPNLVVETAVRGIPLALVNARMSARSFDRWRWFSRANRSLFSAFDLVLAQNASLARRFELLGAPRVVDAGNLKLDSPPPPVDELALAQLRKAFAGRPLVLAASTHAGEEAIMAEAHQAMRATRPGLLTVIVPRHPERGPEIAQALALEGQRSVCRSEGIAVNTRTDIYVADTIGELGLFYTLADVALIGGSFARRGGQNPVEAIKLGSAVLTGPHWHNFQDIYRALLAAGGAREVRSAMELAQALSMLLNDAEARDEMRSRAQAAIAAMGGALARTLAEIEPFLPQRDPMRHAS